MLEIAFLLLALIVLASIAIPPLRHKALQIRRSRAIKRIQRLRNTRVITLIHRQERLSILGIPLLRFIDVEDAEKVLRAIRLTPPDQPIDLIVHTPGGLALPAQQIAYALKQHRAPVTVMVPHYAMSGGALIALAADEIMADPNAVLGSVDPQVGWRWYPLPAHSVLSVLSQKDRGVVDDTTLILADVASKAVRQMGDFVSYLLSDNLGAQPARAIAQALTDGRWTHDFPLTVPTLVQLGLPVRAGLPAEVYALMDLYPQQAERRPAVQYTSTLD